MAGQAAPFLYYLRLLLKPLAKYCLRHSLHIQDFIEAGKAAFLDAAAEELEDSGEKVSLSRLSTMSGIHRRDVTRIYEREEFRQEPLGLISRIIGHWQQDSRFLNASRRPRVLSLQGEPSEFAKLVETVSAELTPGTILYELERIGAVKRISKGVQLTTRIYNPRGNPAEGFSLVSSDIDDLMRGVEGNLFGNPGEENLHLKTQYDRVPADTVPTIREWFLREGSALHQKARNYLSQFDLDLNPSLRHADKYCRIAIGTFGFISEAKGNNSNESR